MNRVDEVTREPPAAVTGGSLFVAYSATATSR